MGNDSEIIATKKNFSCWKKLLLQFYDAAKAAEGCFTNMVTKIDVDLKF